MLKLAKARGRGGGGGGQDYFQGGGAKCPSSNPLKNPVQNQNHVGVYLQVRVISCLLYKNIQHLNEHNIIIMTQFECNM